MENDWISLAYDNYLADEWERLCKMEDEMFAEVGKIINDLKERYSVEDLRRTIEFYLDDYDDGNFDDLNKYTEDF